jgi:sugar phosphate isomerase/epimerase
MYTRRDFGKLALASVPVSAALAARINSKIDGVQLGCQSYSFRDVPLDDAIKGMAEDGCGVCELYGGHIEPPALGKAAPIPARPAGGAGRPGGGAGGGRGRGPVSPEVLEARKKAREDLREWRNTVPLSYFSDVKKKFDDAGIRLVGYNYSFGADFTDEEIDRGFAFAKALGVDIITASTTIPVAQKVVPFAEKHKMMVAMHGHAQIDDPIQFAKPENFAKALEMSKYYRINLDIGHFWTAGYDPVEYIQQHHDKIVILHMKDRKKLPVGMGENLPWGQGDTPIKGVLQLLKTNKWGIPALVEYEYRGAGTSVEEVKKCMDYAKQAIAG